MDNQTKRSRVLKLRKSIPDDQTYKNSLDVAEMLREEFVSDFLLREQDIDVADNTVVGDDTDAADNTVAVDDTVSSKCDKFCRQKVLCFYPLKGEVDLRRFYDELLAENYELYFPKTDISDCSMEFYRVNSLKDFLEGAYGVMEPACVDESRKYQGKKYQGGESETERNCLINGKAGLLIDRDIIICPGVIFDKNGNRGGFGKGYYDRYLNRFDLTKIAVAFEFQVYDEISTNDWDVPMDMLVTERNVYRWK